MMINILKTLLFYIVFFHNFSFGLEKVSLQLQWKYQFQFAGYLIAKEKGFYEEQGLDVDIKEWRPKLDMIQDVIDNKATFSIARSTSFVNEETLKQVQLLAATFQATPLVILTDKNSGIKTLDDFNGKTLMSSGDMDTDASLISMFYSNGVDFKKLKIKQPSFNVEDLLNAKTDLMAAYISNEPYLLKKMGGEPVIFDPKNYGFDFYNDILITNTQMAMEKPLLVQKFLDASLKGWHYAFDHIEESAKIIFKKYNTQNKSLEALIYEGNTLKPLALNGVDELGSIKKEKLQKMYYVYKLLGLSSMKDVDFDQLIFSSNKRELRLTPTEEKYLKNNTIKVGVSPWYPMTFYDSEKQKADGIGIEILNAIAEKFHMKIEFIPGRWNILLQKFKQGEIDLLPTTYYTQERGTFGSFSKPYMNIKEYLYIHEDSSIRGFEDLENKTIAIVKKYGAIERIKKKYPKIKIIEVDTLEQSIKMLINKEADALFNTQFSIESFLVQNHIFSIKSIYQTSFKASPLHFFTQPKNMILKRILQKGLDITKKQDIDVIVSNWLRKSSNSIFSLQELRYIKETPKIKMCTNPNWTPIEFLSNNEPKGITIDILKLISEKTNLNFEYVPTKDWSESQEFLKEKKCDILPSATITSKRKKYANFTKPYLSYSLAIVTAENKPLVGKLEDIIDKTMTRKKASGLITTLEEKYPNIDIIKTPTYKEAFKKVQNDEAYFTIATLPVLSYYKNRYDFDNLQVAGYTKMNYDLSIMVRDDKATLVKILDKALLEVSSEQKKLIHEKWLNIEIESQVDYYMIIKVLIVFLIIMIFFIYKQVLLNKSIKEFEEVIDATMEGILILKGNICIDVNESALKILHYNKKDILGKNIFDFIPDEHHELAKSKMKQTSSKPYELNAITNNGTYLPILARGRDLKNKNLRLVSIVDISILKQQEEQLLQQSKLVSMGEMIGNIAHQWRQPLSVISTSATGMKIQKEYGILEDKFFFEACDAIDNNVQYLSQTIDDFRDFIKGDRKEKMINILNLTQSFIHLVEASAKINEIEIVQEIKEDVTIKSYENELKQCFMNIYNNAKDVLQEQKLERKLFIIKVVKNKDRVLFTFTDNGGGIAKEAFANIFDPYFTTKHKSQGTGLGLSMTYNLITSGMGGSIKAQNVNFRYENKSYFGARFSIRLPYQIPQSISL
jgi:two-component system, NarL family, sensor histidine kinase EvgS